MKIIMALPGDDVADHFHNIYHHMLMTNEPVITQFNEITAVLFPDKHAFEHPIGSPDPRYTYNLNAVKSYYMREIERRQPSGYTDVMKIYDKLDEESRKARLSVKKVKEIILALEESEQSHFTTPAISAILTQLKVAIS